MLTSPSALAEHAGKIGLGPNYNQGSGLSDKIAGKVDEVKGKLTHNPELQKHGYEQRTGLLEEHMKEKAEADERKVGFATLSPRTLAALADTFPYC